MHEESPLSVEHAFLREEDKVAADVARLELFRDGARQLIVADEQSSKGFARVEQAVDQLRARTRNR